MYERETKSIEELVIDHARKHGIDKDAIPLQRSYLHPHDISYDIVAEDYREMGKEDKIRKDKRTCKKTPQTGDDGNEGHSDRLDKRALQGLCGMMAAKALYLKSRDRKERRERDRDANERTIDKSQRKNKEIIELKTILPDVKIPGENKNNEKKGEKRVCEKRRAEKKRKKQGTTDKKKGRDEKKLVRRRGIQEGHKGVPSRRNIGALFTIVPIWCHTDVL